MLGRILGESKESTVSGDLHIVFTPSTFMKGTRSKYLVILICYYGLEFNYHLSS